MGATLRMATALGLHREYNDGQPPGSSSGLSNSRGTEVPVEIRRRTWWSLVCLDTWASMTTGRPSLGRLGPGITVQSPKIPEQMNNANYIISLKLLPIIHNIEFCKLATRIQDKLAGQSLLRSDEIFSLDAELVRWHEELPPILKEGVEDAQQKQRPCSTHQGRPKFSTPSSASTSTKVPFDFSQPPERDNTACPEVLRTPRAIMHWWYLTLRMLMHRPFLLAAALRQAPYASMSAEEKVAIGKCRVIAAQTIADIDSTCRRDDLVAGWNGVWLMYQAVVVPLVSLFSYLSSPRAYANAEGPGRSSTDGMIGGDEDADRWRTQIETAMTFFERMQRFSVAAKKSKDVVKRLYDASKHVRQYHEAFYLQQQLQHNQQQQASPTLGFGDMTSVSGVFDMPGVTNNMPFNVTYGSQNDHLGWGLSPNGDAAMTSFWDDMLWDTFPEMPDGMDATGFAPRTDGYDWPPSSAQTVNTSSQQWTNWNFDDPPR